MALLVSVVVAVAVVVVLALILVVVLFVLVVVAAPILVIVLVVVVVLITIILLWLILRCSRSRRIHSFFFHCKSVLSMTCFCWVESTAINCLLFRIKVFPYYAHLFLQGSETHRLPLLQR